MMNAAMDAEAAAKADAQRDREREKRLQVGIAVGMRPRGAGRGDRGLRDWWMLSAGEEGEASDADGEGGARAGTQQAGRRGRAGQGRGL